MSDDERALRQLRSKVAVLEELLMVQERTVLEQSTRLEQTTRAAVEAERAKATFLANMSHELRTPLNAIIGYSEILIEDAQDAGRGDDVGDLERIHQAGSHLLSLINDILDLSKIDAHMVELHLEPVDLQTLAADVEATVAPLLERRGNALQIQIESGLPRVMADPLRLKQCVLNLLGNANKFTENGQLAFSVSRAIERGPGWLRFGVEDSGIGMTPEQLERIFEAFQQADASTTRKFGGTGLGLSITRSFVEMMGGRIEVQSSLGAGSCFFFSIPLETAEAAEEGPRGSTPAAVAPSDGSTVLIIDDELDSRTVLADTLRRAGFTVEMAESGAEGLAAARQLRPGAITLDVRMPGMDGWQVLAALKQDPDTQDIPVVMVTLEDEPSRGFALGALDFLRKPVDRARLVKILGRICPGVSGARVLVVDDDQGAREIMRRSLEGAGCEVRVATDGEQALEALRLAPVDLMVLDLMMPVKDGFQVLEELRESPELRDTSVVVSTAKDLTADDRRRLHGLVERVLSKGSTTRADLLDEVSRQLRELSKPSE